jgi:hypothetical protein
MDLNADFTKRVVIHGDAVPWKPSPIVGVERRMLERIGDEVARATSIVRYAPNSQFATHTHDGGEEFIVLKGVFQDEHGDYPAGTYIRNPPTTRHTPSSVTGCVIFVKLWQFDMDDRTSVRIDINQLDSLQFADRPGVSVMPLFENARETVQIEIWNPGIQVAMETPDGAELLVLAGGFTESGEVLRPQSWLRIPMGGRLDAVAGNDGARVWIKTRGLRFVEPPHTVGKR